MLKPSISSSGPPNSHLAAARLALRIEAFDLRALFGFLASELTAMNEKVESIHRQKIGRKFGHGNGQGGQSQCFRRHRESNGSEQDFAREPECERHEDCRGVNPERYQAYDWRGDSARSCNPENGREISFTTVTSQPGRQPSGGEKLANEVAATTTSVPASKISNTFNHRALNEKFAIGARMCPDRFKHLDR